MHTDTQAKPLRPKTHIVIPARFASSRLPGKPLLEIHGKPMILWVAKKASQADFADDVCIATDDERIAKVCKQAGFTVVMTRDDHASGTDRLSEVATLNGWHEDDIVINMQGDEPLVPPQLLEQVKTLLENQPSCVMATLCEPILSEAEFARPSVVKVVSNRAGQALYFSRAMIPSDRDHALKMFDDLNNNTNSNHFTSQTSQYSPSNLQPALAYRHLGIYAYRVKLLKDFVMWEQGVLEQLECLEQLRVLEHGERIAVDVAKLALPAGVDTQADLDRLNAMPASNFLNLPF